ncbi:MAG: hypothetical protein QM804_12860 [Propionicimonas sp.]
MTEPVAPLITLLGAPGAACDGDDCLDVPPSELADEDDRTVPTPDA